MDYDSCKDKNDIGAINRMKPMIIGIQLSVYCGDNYNIQLF